MDNLIVILATAAINAAVSWGVFRTQLQWLRSDVNDALDRLDALEGRPMLPRRRRAANEA